MDIRPMVEDDREQFVALLRQSFNQAPPFVARMREAPIDTYRVAVEDNRIVATTGVMPGGHFFGGLAVPNAGVSGVVVAPHARGRRIAETLVSSVLREWRETSPLSSLYPATVPIYRRLGYEFAAIRCTYRIPMNALRRFPDAGDVRPWDDDELDDVMRAQRAWAAGHNGVMERTPRYWDRVRRPMGDDPVYRVLVREDGDVTGSLVYTQENGFSIDVVARDIFWRTPHAARSLITYIARHHSLGRDFVWSGPATDPMLFHIAEHALHEKERWHLMMRVLDMPAAIAARGYAPGADASVTIAVTDPLFADNNGPWRIAVSGGKGIAEPAGAAEITMPVGAFAAVYSGLLTPAQARRAGMAEGAADALERLGAVFAGPPPWTPDFF